MEPPGVRQAVSSNDSANSPVPTDLRKLALYFLRLGTLGFGGPIALVGYMQKDLVENRRCFSQQDYLQGLAFCQLSPGPLAAQLAIYLGWLRAGVLGGTLAGIAFILPSFLMVVGRPNSMCGSVVCSGYRAHSTGSALRYCCEQALKNIVQRMALGYSWHMAGGFSFLLYYLGGCWADWVRCFS